MLLSQRVFLVGGSAGAIEVLREILPALPKEKEKRSFAIIIVLHLLPRGQSLLPTIFRERCPWPVKEAESTEVIENGVVYFGPPDYHLSVEADRRFSLSNEEPVMYSRPSIDLFFESAAPVFKRELVALLLSGANSDGARGLSQIVRYGGRAIAQTPETAEFPEMPRSGLQISPRVERMTPKDVIQFLNGPL